MRTTLRVSCALALILSVGTWARAQDANAEFFPGKRVWVTHHGMLVPTGKIIAVNPDGSYKVEVYAHSTNNDPRSTQPEEANLRGAPVAVIDAPKHDIEGWNKARFTAWVSRNGQPWPKAELVEDTGSSVKVRIFAPDGTTVESVKELTGADLEKFRELNQATAPPASVTADTDEATRKAVEEMNKELEAKNWKLANGETFPRVHTVKEVTDAVRAVAIKYAKDIRSEPNPYKRAELQDQMMREIYVTFERLTWIKHGGRDTTTDAWKAEGRALEAKLPSTASSLQRDIVNRNNACYGKSKIVWEIMNLARVPQISGVGVRLLDGGFHGILYVEYDDHSRRTWETTEGFEPHGTRAFKRWEVQFNGLGSKGKGLDYMDTMTPMSGAKASRLDTRLLLARRALDRSGPSRGLTDILKDRLKDRVDRDKVGGVR